MRRLANIVSKRGTKIELDQRQEGNEWKLDLGKKSVFRNTLYSNSAPTNIGYKQRELARGQEIPLERDPLTHSKGRI